MVAQTYRAHVGLAVLVSVLFAATGCLFDSSGYGAGSESADADTMAPVDDVSGSSDAAPPGTPGAPDATPPTPPTPPPDARACFSGGSDCSSVTPGASCVNLDDDPEHCGICENSCGADEECHHGRCRES